LRMFFLFLFSSNHILTLTVEFILAEIIAVFNI